MQAQPVIAIYDVGKTNKKLFLLDQQYKIVLEKSARFTEIEDEDGYPCENLDTLHLSLFDSLKEVFNNKEFVVKAINFSAYGASFVHLNENGKPVTPLYNYLKPYPEDLRKQFYDAYGGEEEFSKVTASPVLGNLNSGMQLYWLKQSKPLVFEAIKHSLHLPQYLSYLISGSLYTDITSIGCHTNLWNFKKTEYHEWVHKEEIINKLAPIVSCEQVISSAFARAKYKVGIGLHDSSAALIPYLVNFAEPFILISTGTWCISLNPFNHQPLTVKELQCDCLSYLTYQGKPVKASRLFAGNEHELQVKRIADFFNQSTARYNAMEYDVNIINELEKTTSNAKVADPQLILRESRFLKRELSDFKNDKEAYHRLMLDIIAQQYESTSLVLKGTPVKKIFVDGGFSNNVIYMKLLASVFPGLEVYAAKMAQASAVGAALSIHSSWNQAPWPENIIELKYYTTAC